KTVLILETLEKTNSKILIAMLACCLSHCPLIAQNDTVTSPKKAAVKAAVEVIGLNAGIWAFDRYALNADYAKITGKSLKNNLTHKFLWDNDNFDTNLFGHPYCGGLYFNAARSNGLNFWQSIPFSVGGSYHWEIFCEKQPPSLNDIIATPIGGIALGEMTHRISHRIIDGRERGWRRFGRELLVGVISPMDLLNRLLSGDAWHYSPRIYSGYEPPAETPLTINFSVFNRFMVDLDENRNNMNLTLSAGIVYGQPFSEETRTPYDYFTGEADVNIIGNQPFLSNISIVGLIWGKEWQKNETNWLAGIFQHYDYYNSTPVINGGKIPYQFAETASFGGGLLFGKQTGKNGLSGRLYANLILLGANESDYFFLDSRNYNIGNGYSIKSSETYSFGKHWDGTFGFKLYHVFTGKGYGSADAEINGLPENTNPDYVNAQGNKGNTLLGMISLNAGFQLSRQIRLSAEQRFYFRNSHYDYLPDVATHSAENRIKITYNLFK
ncbi:MAG: DUF3943 domain-containing protein, partial [Dysgonamonadaceae bacterium]|nr:DUF3943 domain-containing protein [Dysgonamonadaceae bacterium]